MKANFYDIESLSNVFTLANFKTEENNPNGNMPESVDLYILCDDENLMNQDRDAFRKEVTERVHQKNSNFHGPVFIYDLKTYAGINKLMQDFGYCPSQGLFVNNPKVKTLYKPVCDTDPEYDENIHPYIFGYNSYNYDTTMLAYLFAELGLDDSPESDDDDNVNIRMDIEYDRTFTCQNCGTINHTVHDGHFNLFCQKCGTFRPIPLKRDNTPRITAKGLRKFNNILFEGKNKENMPSVLANGAVVSDSEGYRNRYWRTRKNMLMTGRHLDVARLNEKQRKVGLKRLLGMLGFQILESDKLKTGQDTIETYDQLLDLIAYNVSDVVNLRELFHHPAYQAQFSLKKQLLADYPELIYEQKKNGEYAPDKRPDRVRSDRLCIDSSSAQFSTKCLCPYGSLKDIPAVSFLYPSQKKIDAMKKEAAKEGKTIDIKQIDVLETTNQFFRSKFSGNAYAMEKWERIYKYYKSIEGKNFNDLQKNEDLIKSLRAEELAKKQAIDAKYFSGANLTDEQNAAYIQELDALETIYNEKVSNLKVNSLSDIPKTDTCIEYFDKDGNPTSCFALFSTGGIHGAEYNKALFDADKAEYQKKKAYMDEVKAHYNNDAIAFRKDRKFTAADGTEFSYTEFLKGGRKVEASEWRELEEPVLFKYTDKGNTELNKRYVFTSADTAIHEDFTSYYPNLLIMMAALYNEGLGYDRYNEIFQQKQDFGHKMKDKSLPEADRNMYKIMREGTKLILNSASGAADATFENNIRVNNQIISMRIIGQLFSWRIGQAQAFEGGKITSTNTDGLYSVMEETLNNLILERESKIINVEIEPEKLYLISKDSNNRIEFDDGNPDKIFSASGGTLGCMNGPNPTKSLAHPAIIDWALAHYLIDVGYSHKKGLDLFSEFDDELGMEILKNSETEFSDDAKRLLMFQQVIAASAGSNTYHYGMDKELYADRTAWDSDAPFQVKGDTLDEQKVYLEKHIEVLPNYNRIFMMQPGIDGAMHLCAARAKVVPPKIKAKRKKENITRSEDPLARYTLESNGLDIYSDEIADKDIASVKISGVEVGWDILIENANLFALDDAKKKFILDNLDYEKYLQMLRDSYEKNWRNKAA